MLVQVVALAGIFGFGYAQFKKQKAKYTKELLVNQQQRNKHLKSVEKSQIKLSDKDFAPKRALSLTRKDMAILAVSMGLSSVGYWIFHPLKYLAVPLVFYAGRTRFFGAWKSLKQGKINVQTLTAMTITGAMIGGYYFIGSLLIFINALGDFLASRVIKESHHKLVDFFEEMPQSVWLLEDGVELSVPFKQIKAGDTLVVSAGEIIPADGKIVWGAAGIDEHRFTGESVPAEKEQGDEVFAMTLVLSGKIHFIIEKAGQESSAMQIANILNHTAEYKSGTVMQSQAISQQLVKPAILAGALAWPFFGFSSAVGVLFAHPKERLQISAPISLMTYLKQAMNEGILIKDGRSLKNCSSKAALFVSLVTVSTMPSR